MRIIVAGSRTITNERTIEEAITNSPFWREKGLKEIITGGAKGVDKIAHKWARKHAHTTSVVKADWDLYGKSAGPIRNREMAMRGDALVAIWDGESRGTRSMINIALDLGLDVYVRVVKSEM